MGTTTTNYSLYKPTAGETGYATTFGTSQDTVDTRLKADADAITAVQAINTTQSADILLRWRDLWLPFSVDGVLAATVGTKQFPVMTACSIQGIAARASTAPVGGTGITIDLNRNGTTVLSTKAIIAAGSNAITNTPVFSATTLTVGQYLSVDIDGVGTTTPGSNLVVVVALRLT